MNILYVIGVLIAAIGLAAVAFLVLGIIGWMIFLLVSIGSIAIDTMLL